MVFQKPLRPVSAPCRDQLVVGYRRRIPTNDVYGFKSPGALAAARISETVHLVEPEE
jgi:hypothetical protein